VKGESHSDCASVPTLGWRGVALAVGPGLVVMLADTDAGSVITAAQSGARWGYRLLLLQILIIPVLFMVQELTVRLGVATGKGYGELILQRFGQRWAWLSIATLGVSCFGALVTEMSGLAGVGQLFGLPVWQTISVLVVLIFLMVCTGSYHSVERIAIVLGLFELAFLVVAWKASPDVGEVLAQVQQMPLGDSDYLYLLAANLGTSVMPWTVFYQQSAIVDKGLAIDRLKVARLDTLFGAILCQLVTAAIVVAAAATIGKAGSGANLENVPQIAGAFTPALGYTVGRVVFAVGLSGGALVALIVVCLSAAWAAGEVTGFRHSLEHHPADAPWFYTAFGVILVAGGLLVASGVNLVRLSIATGVVNALLLPIVLGFLYRLACTELPQRYRLKGCYAKVVGLIFLVTAGLGLYAGIFGALG
jgi:NRAMP (natural resistance-associated macrophage protein)-like metal ion transporter